jgi:hypothetical protein
MVIVAMGLPFAERAIVPVHVQHSPNVILVAGLRKTTSILSVR